MNSMTRKLALVAGLGLAGLTGLSYTPPATAQVIYNVVPPPPRFEPVPAVRVGYVWAPGYWRWDGYARRHVWVTGYWVRARPGYIYRPARWEPYGRGYRFHPGYWGR